MQKKITAKGVPIVQPTGGHALYIDARSMLPHIPNDQYPAWSLTNALYLLGGIRGVEIGSVMFGLQPDGSEVSAPLDLVRLAFPRRMYTQSHVDYVAEIILALNARKENICGHRIVKQSPIFTAFHNPDDTR